MNQQSNFQNVEIPFYPSENPFAGREQRFRPLRGSQALKVEMIIQMPDDQARRFSMETPSMLLGRTESADLTLSAPVVSRQHARIEQVGDELWLTDLGSTNGTMVNGAFVRSCRIENGDLITIGLDSAYPIRINVYMQGGRGINFPKFWGN